MAWPEARAEADVAEASGAEAGAEVGDSARDSAIVICRQEVVLVLVVFLITKKDENKI
jgi:hypothetical protein